MKLQTIFFGQLETLNENFTWSTETDKEWFMSLKSLINKNNGMWISKKQRDFFYMKKIKNSQEWEMRTPQNLSNFYGVDSSGGDGGVVLSATTRWADYGSRSVVSVIYCFVLDSIGVVSFWKVGVSGNMKVGSRPNPDKTKLEWKRPVNVDASHLDDTEEDKEKEERGFGVSSHLGNEGERINFGEVELVIRREAESYQYSNYSSASRYWNMYKDSKDNIIYHTGTPSPLEPREKGNLIATVKKHIKTKKGENVTTVIRPKIT